MVKDATLCFTPKSKQKFIIYLFLLCQVRSIARHLQADCSRGRPHTSFWFSSNRTRPSTVYVTTSVRCTFFYLAVNTKRMYSTSLWSTPVSVISYSFPIPPSSELSRTEGSLSSPHGSFLSLSPTSLLLHPHLFWIQTDWRSLSLPTLILLSPPTHTVSFPDSLCIFSHWRFLTIPSPFHIPLSANVIPEGPAFQS